MTAKLSKSAFDIQQAENPAAATIEAWMNFNRPMLTAWTELNGKLIEQATKANHEWLGFLGRRMNEDMALSKRFMECKSLQDVVALYSEFFQRAQKQYQDEFQNLARFNQQFADETASVMRAHLEQTGSEMRH